MKGSLNKRGGFIKKQDLLTKLGSSGFIKLKNKLIVREIKRSKNTPGFPKTHQLHKEINVDGIAYMRFPRSTFWKLKILCDEVSVVPVPESLFNNATAFSAGHDLYEEQLELVNYLIREEFSDPMGESSCIFVQEPGHGKTFVSVGVMQRLNQKTMIVVPNSAIMEQWITVIEEWMPQLKIGKLYSGKKSSFAECDVIVAIINSALSNPPDVNTYGFLIVDECHLCSTTKRCELFWNSTTRFNLGITATPDESVKGMDRIVHAHLGKLVKADDILAEYGEDLTTKWATQTNVIEYFGPDKYTETIVTDAGIVSTTAIVGQLVDDPYRNQLIVNKAKTFYSDAKRYTFIMTDRRDHVETIFNMLSNQNVIVNAPELGYLRGGVSKETAHTAITEARIIVCTFAFTGVGISIKKMNTLILATPRRNNMKQISGRIFRKGSDPATDRIIVDIWDKNTALKSQFYDRHKEYKRRKATITKTQINWKDESLVLPKT
jgi:superfamily II DNA or RNA helicase